MTIPSDDELTRFHGPPVVNVEDGVRAGIEGAAWRVSPGYDEGVRTMPGRISDLIDRAPVRALVIDNWGDPAESALPVTEIAASASRLPGLRALRVRGSQNLETQPVKHTALRERVFGNGGLPAEVTRAVATPILTGERLGGALPDARIDASESRFGEADDERYVAVGE
ncbi:hypothetical protein [Cryptosporangium arvum]|uniref:Uncharacterized protein n=1 Tax=Cryptosporangium arvum DSM 44712 TaxID=927661 RepID=A0A011AFV2_9ACTN|nr:hypothetical protein [Cryptosporangium arvum]EXG80906.1 hypothetical protein CryarDRAFT_2001 [Cryptosporangium arvum DSM 44712]